MEQTERLLAIAGLLHDIGKIRYRHKPCSSLIRKLAKIINILKKPSEHCSKGFHNIILPCPNAPKRTLADIL